PIYEDHVASAVRRIVEKLQEIDRPARDRAAQARVAVEAVLRERVKVPLPLAEHGRRRHDDDLTLALRREHDGRGDRERDERLAHADLVREDLARTRFEPAQQLLRGAALAL